MVGGLPYHFLKETNMPYQLKLGPIAMATLGFAMLCAAPARASDTVKIAFIACLSGPFARAGEGGGQILKWPGFPAIFR